MKKRRQENIDGIDYIFMEDMEEVSDNLKDIEKSLDKTNKMLKRQLKPATTMSQQILQWILNFFGIIYVLIEKHVKYPDDDIILGMEIDEDLQTMSRQQLCRYMDAVLPKKGFFDIQSTSKIRLGCQLLREYKQLKKLKEYNEIQTGDYNDVDF